MYVTRFTRSPLSSVDTVRPPLHPIKTHTLKVYLRTHTITRHYRFSYASTAVAFSPYPPSPIFKPYRVA